MNNLKRLEILTKVEEYLKSKYIDPQMGIGETKFEDLVLFIYQLNDAKRKGD